MKARSILKPWVARPLDPKDEFDGPWVVEGVPMFDGGSPVVATGLAMGDALELAAGIDALSVLMDAYEEGQLIREEVFPVLEKAGYVEPRPAHLRPSTTTDPYSITVDSAKPEAKE